MNLNTFFEFPGILILVGIVLLIVSIIIGLFAYKKVDKEDIVFSLSNEEEKNNEKNSEDNLVKEVTVIDEPNLVENKIFNNMEHSYEMAKEENFVTQNQGLQFDEIKTPENIMSKTEVISLEPINNIQNEDEEDIEML